MRTRYPTRGEALESEVRRLREENKKLRRGLGELMDLDRPRLELAAEPFRAGWSNRRIAERLGVSLSEARKLTLPIRPR